MFRLCCGSRSSVNDVRINDQPAVTTTTNGRVIEKYHNSGTDATSLSEAKAQNAAIFQNLLAIKNPKPVSKPLSANSYEPGQIQLLYDAATHLIEFWDTLHTIVTPEYYSKDEATSLPHSMAVQYKKDADDMLQAATVVRRINEPLENAYSLLKTASSVYDNTNYSILRKTALNPEVSWFFKRRNFNPMGVIEFHRGFLKILSGKILPLEEDDNVAFNKLSNETDISKVSASWAMILNDMTKTYAERGILKNQLPTVKEKFNSIKKTLNKDFVILFEGLIKLTELSIKNMELPAVKEIMEQVAPKARPQLYKDYIRIDNDIERMFATPSKVQNEHLAKLKLVSLDLV